jgi:hypothetical protein
VGPRLNLELEVAWDPATERSVSTNERSNKIKLNLPQESVIVRNLRLHLHAIHDLLFNIKGRDDPSDNQPQPRFDEVDTRAPPSPRTEHVVSWVQTFLRLGIDGFEEPFGFERTRIGVNRLVP